MKKLRIDWLELGMAFEFSPDEHSFVDEALFFFDKESGAVNAVDELGCDPEENSEPIPRFESHEVFQWMNAFVETVCDEQVRMRLGHALCQHKPFCRFHDEIGSDRRLRHNWRSFEMTRQRATIIQWLRSIDVEPLNPDDPVGVASLPDLRQIMFAEVLRFVRVARELAGVLRIALIGSLTSSKEFPKDIDLLVTITDKCDLTQLAQLSRQLSGHMNAHSCGADVFLAGPTGEYLGRVCPWKRCAPGIRTSCDAQSCGLRHYLHDDFGAVRLNRDLIQTPPVLLWPKACAAASVPADVNEQLIEPLSLDANR